MTIQYDYSRRQRIGMPEAVFCEGKEAAFIAGLIEELLPQTDHPVLLQTARELDAYFAGKGFNFSIPLDMAYGTAFQQQVWKCLREIPTGGTTTYGAISHRLGNPNAVRAVGGAVGRNPVGIIVPCHRVIGTNGALTGYAGGLERKVALLTLEGIDLPAVVRSESHPTTGNLF